MMRSMFSAISGLRNHQLFMDTVGNNIANINTTAFKASRVTFQDIMSQTLRGASAAGQGLGGVNPAQVGLGIMLAGIDTVQTQGNLQSTGKLTDMAIQGNGFFVVNDGTRNLYSRDGAFDIATDGTIVNPASGMRVMGWQADSTGAVDTTAPVGAVTIPLGQGMIGEPTTALSLNGNLNAALPSYGAITQSNAAGGTGSASGVFTGAADMNYVVRINGVGAGGVVSSVVVSTDGGATYGAAITPTAGVFALPNGLSFTIADEPANAVGNSYSFTATVPKVQTTATVYDSLGTAHALTLTFQKSATANTWTYLATTTEAGVTLAPATPTSITFGSSGQYSGASPAGQISLTLSNGATTPLTFGLNLSTLTQLAGTTDLNGTADGAAAGSLVTFSVSKLGEITGVYSNGLKKTLGQLAMASFVNPGGLLRGGQNLYEESSNSGAAQIGQPGSGDRGEIATGFLEMSNVDLAQQFTNMIMAERGFQANSRVITTSDEMLQDLVNIKR